MAEDEITKQDILDKFLVTSKYGEPGGWPHETVAACKIILTDEDGEECVSHQVYRNVTSGEHAEVQLIEYLKKNRIVKSSKKIIIRVYINYSPCSSCADEILKYIEEEDRIDKMTITFANFYNTHVYGRNTQENANKNIIGLIALHDQPEVKLRLFGVHVGWERFLEMREFLSLTEDEKNKCLNKAESLERRNREVQDKLVWYDIFGSVKEITSKLDRSEIRKLRDAFKRQKENTEARGQSLSLEEFFEKMKI